MVVEQMLGEDPVKKGGPKRRIPERSETLVGEHRRRRGIGDLLGRPSRCSHGIFHVSYCSTVRDIRMLALLVPCGRICTIAHLHWVRSLA
jgi:hypothetical protein